MIPAASKKGFFFYLFLTTAWAVASEVEFRIIEIDPDICPHTILKRTDVNEGRFFYIPRVTLAMDKFNRSFLFDIWEQINGDRVYSFKFSFLTLDDVDSAAEVFEKRCDKDALMRNLRDRNEIPKNTPDEELKNYYPGPIIPSAIQVRLPDDIQPHIIPTPNSVLENDIITYVGASPVSLLVRLPPLKQQDFDTALTSHGGIPMGVRIRFSTRMLLGYLQLTLAIKNVYTWIEAKLTSGQAIPYVELQTAMQFAFEDKQIDYTILSVGDIGDDKLGVGQITELIDKLLLRVLAQEFGSNDPGATKPGGVVPGTMPQFFIFNITARHKESSHKVAFNLTRLSGDEVDQWALIPYNLSVHSDELQGVHQMMVEPMAFGDNAQFSHLSVKTGDLIKVNLYNAWFKIPKRRISEEWLTRDMFKGPALDSEQLQEGQESRYIGQVPKSWGYLREDGNEDDWGEIWERYGTSSWFFWLGFNHYKKFKIVRYDYADPDRDPDDKFEFNPVNIEERYGEPWLMPVGLRIGSGNLVSIRDYVRGRESDLEYQYDPRINVMSFRADKNGQLFFGNLERAETQRRLNREFYTVVFNGMWEKAFGSDSISRQKAHTNYKFFKPIEVRTVIAFKVEALPKGTENMNPYERNLDRQHQFQNPENKQEKESPSPADGAKQDTASESSSPAPYTIQWN